MSRPSTTQRPQTLDNPGNLPVPHAPHRQGLRPAWPIPQSQPSPCKGKSGNQRRLAKPSQEFTGSSKTRSEDIELTIRNKESAVVKHETIKDAAFEKFTTQQAYTELSFSFSCSCGLCGMFLLLAVHPI